MKKILSFLLIFFLTSCETVSDFNMPNLGMPDLAKYNINPFTRNASQEPTCSKPMILADAISITEFQDFGSNDESNIIYRGRIDRIDYECNIEPNYTLGNLIIIGTLSLGQDAKDNSYTLPAFVAVINKKKEVISRSFVDINVGIPEGATLARFEFVLEDFKLNFERSKNTSDYQILVGFKLTADQVEFNKNL
tara:strand:+ start:57 stop:635 length:579 start_codon:yes stop_codon:yes gene_type:complete